MSRNVFTTGQIAKICNVAPRTVSNWFDSGRLRGFKIPGSRARRIPRERLIEFLKAHGMPLNGLEETRTKVLLISTNGELMGEIEQLLAKYKSCFICARAANNFQAGMRYKEARPDFLVLDFANQGNADEIIRSVELDVVIIAVVPEGRSLLVNYVNRVKKVIHLHLKATSVGFLGDIHEAAEQVCNNIVVDAWIARNRPNP